MLHAYVVFVRPLLECASVVWNPALNRRSHSGCLPSTDKLESVQHLFTHRLFWCCGLPLGLSYLECLRFLGLEPLQLRRLKTDLCMVYKICNGLVYLESDPIAFFEPCDSCIRGHFCRFRIPHCRSDVRANFFSQHVLIPRNSLPDCVVSSSSLNMFKH